jgi:hypothetical protein
MPSRQTAICSQLLKLEKLMRKMRSKPPGRLVGEGLAAQIIHDGLSRQCSMEYCS